MIRHFRLAGALALALLGAGCDKCGNWFTSPPAAPKACGEARP